MSIAARELAQSIWFLVGQIDETGPSRCIPIHSTPFLVGRRPDLALHLPRPTVSTVHAELRIENGALILRDLKSTNGSYVNGYRIEGEVCLGEEDLVQFADIAFRIRRQVAGNAGRTICEDVVDHALALVQFDKLMRERAVLPAFQPIVELDTLRAIGHEVLGRSNLVGLETPQAMFQAASRLDLEMELSRMLRWEGIRVGASVPALEHLFVNTHPHELGRPELLNSLRTTRDANRTLALTLEIHEAAVTDLAMMRELRVELSKLNIGLAFDDFGAGQARLVELIEVKPDYLKFDMRLIRGIDQAAASRQQVLATLVKMSHNVGSKPLAEGVETAGEHETCRQMGFELGQGFFYGKPAPSTLYDNTLLAR